MIAPLKQAEQTSKTAFAEQLNNRTAV